ncbi:RagB/SusD family nutrient uptake outer membrane protein [Geofilum sp. OHC36d9]|uniref:RagB/SusD family nutrient uptake outer membrane protein n=1 Tax=Geofilum sp. OHC36d9 TaxID=3458413 RepID=UPI004034D581
MKKLLYFVLGSALVLFSGCDDFLDTESYTRKDTTNFPQDAEDVEMALVGAYNTLNTAVADPQNTYFYAAELASDDRFGGGGENDKLMQAWDKIMNYSTDASQPFWKARYYGIFRTNSVINSVEDIGLEGDDIDVLKGEALFLRAFFYHELAEMYGDVPLFTTTLTSNIPRTDVNLVYAQIASDLKESIGLLKSEPYDNTEAGHVTKWAAEALMARVFLFYTGFYEKETLPLVDGSAVSKSEVVAWLEDCIDNSGHGLVGDFRDLWSYTNQYTLKDWPAMSSAVGVDGEPLAWAGDGNKESVFAIKFSNFADWNTTIGYSNQYMLHFGMRGGQPYANTFPFGQGWGAGPVNPQLIEDWKAYEDNDIRRDASVIDVNTLPDYSFGGWNDFMEETDYWQMKCIHATAKDGTDADGNDVYVSSYSVLEFGSTDNFQLDGVNDLMLIRFADVLLMHSELTETNNGMNEVRQRAGLSGKPYTLENLKNERRFELAFEGRRWADIRRWGDAPDLLEKQEGQPIYRATTATTMKAFGGGYRARYEATNGFFAIPESEINLSNGVLEQNPGYINGDGAYQGWQGVN